MPLDARQVTDNTEIVVKRKHGTLWMMTNWTNNTMSIGMRKKKKQLLFIDTIWECAGSSVFQIYFFPEKPDYCVQFPK